MEVSTVKHAANPVHVYKVSLSFDMDRIPKIVRGPIFSPIPGCLEKFCFEMNFFQFKTHIYLVSLSSNANHLEVLADITIQNQNGVVFAKIPTFIKSVKEKHCLDQEFQIPTSKNKSEIFLVTGTLTFSGYNVNPSISSNFAEKSSTGREELIKDYRTMYETGFAWDVTFSVDDQTLHAHKAILCCRSPVLSNMFSLDMEEKNSNSVNIQDVNFHVFNCFLLYLYTSIIEDERLETVLTLFSLANKYEVASLRKECSRLLGNNLTIESICSILVLADLHNEKELKEVAKKFLHANVFQVVGTAQWVEIVSNKPELAKEVLGSKK